MRRLKNAVIFFQTVLRFVLPRKIINTYNDIIRKYGNARVVLASPLVPVLANIFMGFLQI